MNYADIEGACLPSPAVFNVYEEYIIKSSLRDRPKGGKINAVVINNIRYSDDTIVMVESAENCSGSMEPVRM